MLSNQTRLELDEVEAVDVRRLFEGVIDNTHLVRVRRHLETLMMNAEEQRTQVAAAAKLIELARCLQDDVHHREGNRNVNLNMAIDARPVDERAAEVLRRLRARDTSAVLRLANGLGATDGAVDADRLTGG